MYIKLKDRVFIRKIEDICYFQNRAYNTDIMFGGSAYDFAKYLKYDPIDEKVIIDEICKEFEDTSIDSLMEDITEFFDILENSGFVVRGKSIDECNYKDNFDYSIYDSDKVKFDNNKKKYSDKETSIEMQEYLKEHPTIMSFQFEITKNCNERCRHCYVPRKDLGEELPFELFEKSIKELADMGTIGIIISGGEPMTHSRFIDFLHMLQKYDFAVSILSNLTLMNDEILNEFKKFRQISIQTSLYSMDPEIHDKVTRLPGSQVKTKNTIEKLVENQIIVQVSSPAININKDSFPAVIDWCENTMHIRAHTDYAIMAEADGCKDNLDVRLTPREVKVFINNLIKNDKEYQEMLMSASLDRNINFKRDPNEILCGIGIDSLAMSANGDIIPCSGFESMACGNVKNETIKNIWLNSERLNLIRKLRYKDYPKCLTCENSAYCSLCLKRIEGETGNIYELAPHFCEVAKINKEVAEEWRRKLSNKN